MFSRNNDDGFVSVADGIERKTLVSGEKTLLTEFRLEKGSQLPRHSHPHEQTGFLVSGKMRIISGGETFDAQPGDSWCIYGGVEHGAEALLTSIAIEVFSPVRDEFLPD